MRKTLTGIPVPPKDHRIIGFFGTSGRWGMCHEFGIVTAPRNVVLPDSVYDLEELQNKPEQDGHRNKRRRVVCKLPMISSLLLRYTVEV